MTVSKQPVRVRFAPSPTGPFHIGSARTALFNWLFARQNDGKFVLRIEDTDASRSEKKYEDEIFTSLKWLGFEWDEGPSPQSGRFPVSEGSYCPYRQSERREKYKKYLKELIREKKAYWCYCTKEELDAQKQAFEAQGLPPKYSGHCRNLIAPPAGKSPQVIRFATPDANVEFKDIIRGLISFDASLFGDFVLAKTLDNPLYNFAATVDDEEMKITHIIRGEEHLSNTPKQILLQKALGFGALEYAHLPLILNPDRSKMSKRFADTALLDYRDQGYLPEAVVNFLALLGWHPKDEQEIFPLAELAEKFDIKRLQKAGAVFSQEKLDWLNAHYLRKLGNDEILELLRPEIKKRGITSSGEFLIKIIAEEKERMKKLSDFFGLTDFFFKLPVYKPQLLIWKNESVEKIKEILKKSSEILAKVPEDDFNRHSLMTYLAELTEINGRGAVLWPLRAAVSGKSASPDPLVIMEILGKEETLKRIKTAINLIL